MPGEVSQAGQVVRVIDGVYRGRCGVVCGEPEGTNSVRVRLEKRSAYDATRPPDFAWVPLEFLEKWGK